MPSISISPTCIVFDGEDVTKMVTAYRMEACTGDVPLVVLELKPGIVGSSAIFAGVADVRIAQDMPTPLEFLEGIDASVLEEAALHGTGNPIADALDVLRDLARATQP